MHRGFTGRCHHLVVVHVGACNPQVVGDRARVQEGILHDDAQLAPEPVPIDVADVEGVDQDASALRFVDPRQQPDQRRLAGTRRPHDTDRFACGDMNRETVKDGSARFVFDAYVFQHQFAPGPLNRRRRFTAFLIRLEDVVDASQGNHRLAGLAEDLAEMPYRPDDHRHLHHEGEQLADRECPAREKDAAGDEHDADLRRTQEVGDRPVDAGQAVQALAVVAQGDALGTEVADFVLLACKGTDHADAGEILLQASGEGALGLVGDLELRPHLREEVVRPPR